jgi:1-acyl-sn-glycerol-3-phosphate acyltransferase
MRVLKVTWVCWFYFTFSILFILYLVPFVSLMRWKKSHGFLHFLRRWFTKVQLLVCGVIVVKRFESGLPPRGAVFCFNHSSILDILIPMAAFRRQIRFVGKKELGRIPLFGIVFRNLDIPIDRESNLRSYDALGEAVELLHRGVDIFIAPEGTTSAKAPEMLAFKNGAFWLAERAQVPIVPVVFLDNWRLLHYDKKWDGRPGISRLSVLTSVTLGSADELKARTKAAMEAGIRG